MDGYIHTNKEEQRKPSFDEHCTLLELFVNYQDRRVLAIVNETIEEEERKHIVYTVIPGFVVEGPEKYTEYGLKVTDVQPVPERQQPSVEAVVRRAIAESEEAQRMCVSPERAGNFNFW